MRLVRELNPLTPLNLLNPLNLFSTPPRIYVFQRLTRSPFSLFSGYL